MYLVLPILQTLFFVASLTDLDELRDSINKHYNTQSYLVLSVNDMYLCYECIEVTVFAGHCNVRLLLPLPVQTFDRKFSLYSPVTLGQRTGNSQNFVRLTVKLPYLLLGESKQRYLFIVKHMSNDALGSRFLYAQLTPTFTAPQY